jgi:hypothetical protein
MSRARSKKSKTNQTPLFIEKLIEMLEVPIPLRRMPPSITSSPGQVPATLSTSKTSATSLKLSCQDFSNTIISHHSFASSTCTALEKYAIKMAKMSTKIKVLNGEIALYSKTSSEKSTFNDKIASLYTLSKVIQIATFQSRFKK